MSKVLLPDDAKYLNRLCEAGRLYEIEQWICAGRSLNVPDELRKTPLSVALARGFHSLVELLLRHEESQDAKNEALAHALQMRRRDLVELAVTYGAEVTSVTLSDALATWDKSIVSFFLERGADPIAGYPFAYAFEERIRTALGSYLDCRRSHPELAQQLQQQADMALRHFCHEGNLKWVSLLMWAGADPRSSGPTLEDIDDPDMFTTAFREACASGHLEILKRLRPDRERDDLGGLLRSAAFSAHTETIAYLLDLGAMPNDKPEGGSSALDAAIRHLGWEDLDRVLYHYGPHHQTPAYKVSKTREAVRLLVERGAAWKPDPSSLNDARRILYKIDPEVTVEFAGLLLKHQACDDATLHELLRTPRMQQHIAPCEPQLSRVGLALDGRRKSKVREAGASAPSAYVLAHYDREKLHKDVWSEPTQKVAARYGISDVALTKVCRQLRIPKPPRGFWAKKAAGRPVPRPPKLPPLDKMKSAD